MPKILSRLTQAKLQDIVHALDKGEVTSTQLVTEYLARIERDNIKGRGLRAVMEVAPRIQVIAAAVNLDEERARGQCRSPLHGVPILIKDCIPTAAKMGMQTTGGTIILEDTVVAENAALVDRLLSAGMIILGKANMTVFGNFWGSNTPWGWSPRGGQVVSAVDPQQNPGGSSTGCAVGLSAGFCAASIGSELDGSIVTPALRAGLFALKPTRGLVSAKGVQHPDRICLGPMGKSVWDVAAMLEEMVEPKKSFVRHAVKSKEAIGGYRLGVPRSYFPADEALYGKQSESLKAEARARFEDAVGRLGSAVALDSADIAGVEELWGKDKMGDNARFPPYGPLMYQTQREHYLATNDWLAKIKNCKIKSIEDLVEWNASHRDSAFASDDGNQSALEAAIATGGKESDKSREAMEWLKTLIGTIEAVFDDNHLDVLVFPASSWGATALAATRGYPLATIPIGLLSDKTPVALFLMAKMGHEEKLIEVMACCEAVFGAK